MGLQGFRYKFDVVFVVDASYYETPMMTKIKEIMFGTIDILLKMMKIAGKDVEQLRMRVINFANFATYGENAIRSTEFFTMPLERDNLEQAIEDTAIHCSGGNAPKNGLEALYTAMKSDWVDIKRSERGRHFIIMLTDSYPLNLGESDGCVGYHKSEYPADIEKLKDKWDADSETTTLKLSPYNKRLFIIVPEGADKNGHTWDTVAAWEWTNAVYPIDDDLEDIDCESICLELIADIIRS